MSGLREKKKEKTKRDILNYAEIHFREYGFQGAKTARIAADASVAEGTLFNYFPSKGVLFIESLFKKDILIPDASSLVRAESLEDALIRVLKVVHDGLYSMSKVPKNMIQEYFSISFSPDLREGKEAMESLMDMDRDLIACISGIIGEEAAVPVYHHVIMNFLLFAYSPQLKFEEALIIMEKQIRFTLIGHFKENNIHA